MTARPDPTTSEENRTGLPTRLVPSRHVARFRFVKNLGKDTTLCPNGMDVAKLTQKKVLQTLENGVRFGKWVLLENIGEVRERPSDG